MQLWLVHIIAMCAACSAVGAVSTPGIDGPLQAPAVAGDAAAAPDFQFYAEQLDQMLSNSSDGSKSCNCPVCDALLADLQQLPQQRESLESLLDDMSRLAGIPMGPRSYCIGSDSRTFRPSEGTRVAGVLWLRVTGQW